MRAILVAGWLTVLFAAAPALAVSDNRGYVAGMFGLEIDGSDAGWIMSIDGGEAETEVQTSKDGNLTIDPTYLLNCRSFFGTFCGPQQLIIDSSSFTNGSDDFDIIGFGYDPGNCCIVLYSYFANGTFLAPGFHRSIGPGTAATLQITSVPEPASWALLIAGFGLVGATLRRCRSVAAPLRIA